MRKLRKLRKLALLRRTCIVSKCPLQDRPRRWVRFRYDALRLLHEHGAALHAAGWDAIDVFGLHCKAPEQRPDGKWLAWLIRNAVVVGIASEAVTIRADDGVVQRVFTKPAPAKLASVVAWALPDQSRVRPATEITQ